MQESTMSDVHAALATVSMAFWLASMASAQQSAATLAASREPNATPSFGTTLVIPSGLRGDIYFLPKDTTVLPDFENTNLEPVGAIWTTTLNIPPRHWRDGFPGVTKRNEWFAINYTGRFWIDKPGRYRFLLLSDDGSNLYIDGQLVIDNDCLHPPATRGAAVILSGGIHRIRVPYFQGPRDCLALVLTVAGPDEPWRIFNTEDFKPPSNPEDWKYGTLTQMGALRRDLNSPGATTAPDPNHRSLRELLGEPPKDPLIFNPTDHPLRDPGAGCWAYPVRKCSRD
jgi:hypothetical protein